MISNPTPKLKKNIFSWIQPNPVDPVSIWDFRSHTVADLLFNLIKQQSPLILKASSTTNFMFSISRSCGIFVYSFEKSYEYIDLALLLEFIDVMSCRISAEFLITQ